MACVLNEVNRLRWKCRRGMKELDLVLLHYLEHHYTLAENPHKEAFELILEMQDPELYFLVLGKTESEDKSVMDIIQALRDARHH